MTRSPGTRLRAGRTPGSCSAIAAELWSYLDGELRPASGRRVARHLETCQACERMAMTLRALLEECRAAGCGPLPREIRARARRRAIAVLRPR
jgi:anti-sigma factor RsiW